MVKLILILRLLLLRLFCDHDFGIFRGAGFNWQLSNIETNKHYLVLVCAKCGKISKRVI